MESKKQTEPTVDLSGMETGIEKPIKKESGTLTP